MPDSQKSGFDKASESVSSAGDKVAGSMQPGTSYLLFQHSHEYAGALKCLIMTRLTLLPIR